MSHRQRIAIDIDEVISSQTDALIAYSNKQFGTNLTRNDFMRPGEYRGYYTRVWDMPEEEGGKRFQQFLADKGPMLQVIEHQAMSALKELKERYNLYIVSARGSDYHSDTVEWLSKTAPNVFSGVHFIEQFNTEGQEATKATICKVIGADYLIDDNVDHCRVAQEEGVQGLLFGEYGWNVHLPTPPGVVRVKDWAGVLEFFNGRPTNE